MSRARKFSWLAGVTALVCSAMLLGAADLDSRSASKTKARILLVTGIDYPGHLWRQTTPVLTGALRKDPRLEVVTIEDPNFLESSALQKYDAVLLHFQTWEPPFPGERAKENLRQFVASGKGVVLVHFACGSWHGEWPEFGKIAGRVWFGQNPPAGRQQHDPYGPFTVEIVKPEHPIVSGMQNFQTQDELYTCLMGDHPIQVLATAKSKNDGKDYPMAFVSKYEQGRTFHCVLGHDAKALSTEPVQELYRRGCAWAAGLAPVRTINRPTTDPNLWARSASALTSNLCGTTTNRSSGACKKPQNLATRTWNPWFTWAANF